MSVQLIAVVATTISISFLCSVLEATLLSITHSHVARLEAEGQRSGKYLRAMMKKIDEPIAAILTLNTISNTAGAAAAGYLAGQVFGNQWVGLFTAVLTLVILLFAEIVPKTIGAVLWKRLSGFAAYTLRGMIVVMKPVLFFLSIFSRLITPKGGRPSTISRADMEILAEIGRREGTLDEDEWKVVTNIMRLDEVTIAQVMTPRTDMVAVPHDATLDEAKNLMLDEGHLRLPVFEESLDRIVGIVLARDLWRADRDGVSELREVIRPAQFAPSTKLVDDLIQEMRQRRDKMVIVLDEFGGTDGLVTLEDLLEEIVGEIQDEHEGDEPDEFQELWGGRIRIWGGTSMREVSDRLKINLPDDPQHDTIGGHLFGRLNRIPRVGDVIQGEDGTFRVVRMEGRRIEYVLFTPAVHEPGR